MRASHPLLVLFAGFLLTVIVRSPGSTDGLADNRPDKVVHTWVGKKPVIEQTVLRGRLIDLTGAAVKDAELEDRLGGGTTRSDGDGSFELAVASGHCLHLAVAAEGVQENRFTVLPDGSPVTLLVRPSRPWLTRPSPVATKLHGGQGLIQGGHGRVFVTVSETGESVCADGSGNYRIPVPKRQFHLVAHDERGRVATSDEITAPRDHQRWMPLPTLTLADGHRVGGYVRRPTGEPVGGASLVLRAASGQGATRRVVADGSGAFEVDGLAQGTYAITALPHQGLVGCTQQFDVGPTSPPADLELALQAELPLELTVIDEAGAAQAGVFVQVSEAGNTWSAGATDATGKVMIRGLSKREKRFEVFAGSADDYAPLEVLRFDAAESQLIVR